MLDDERREAFLGALRSLKDENEEGERRERLEKEYREEQLKRDIEESRRQREDEERRREELNKKAKSNTGGTSEIDYGIEDETHGTTNGSVTSNNPRQSNFKSSKPSTTKPRKPTSVEKSESQSKQKSMIEKAGIILRNFKVVLENLGGGFNLRNPMVVLRMIGFLAGIVAIFGRREVRERVRRLMGEGLGRVKRTVGMGVKVSYI